jgi:hypothetical protein
MMPTIRISDQTYDRLKQHARPFEDKPEDIIVLALDALEKFKKAGLVEPAKAPKIPAQYRAGDKTPQKAFRMPLLKTLAEYNGQASLATVKADMEKRMDGVLHAPDFENVSSGEQRWWNAICWERNECVKDGLIDNDGERGVWKLTEKGMDVAMSE